MSGTSKVGKRYYYYSCKYLDNFIGDANDLETRHKLLDLFISKIYVYPDKLALTFRYTDEQRELPFAETEQLLDNRQSILPMLDGRNDPANAPAGMFESLTEPEEEHPGFFP